MQQVREDKHRLHGGSGGYWMTSFDHVMIPTRGNWFQTNPLEHESNDRTGNTVSSMCVTNEIDMALQWQI